MKNVNELIQRSDNRQKTRKAIGADTKKEDGKWEKDTNAQLGYGEITKGALTNLLSTL